MYDKQPDNHMTEKAFVKYIPKKKSRLGSLMDAKTTE